MSEKQPNEKHRALIESYRGGLSFKACGQRHGVSMQAAHAAVTKWAPELIRPRSIPAEQAAPMLRFLEGFPTQALEGCSLEEVVKAVQSYINAVEGIGAALTAYDGDPFAATEHESRCLSELQALLHKLKPESGDGS